MRYPAALAALLIAPGAFAADRLASPLQDYFRLTAGVFSATTTTEARLDASDDALGTVVSGEDDFGLRDRSELTDIEAELHARKRHKVRFNYFQLNRRATVPLQRNILFGDDLYTINEITAARLDVSDFSATYSYLFMRRERFEIGASLGLHLFQFEGAADIPARFVENSSERSGPLPAIGLEGAVRLTRRLHAELRVEYLDVHVDDMDLGLTNWRARVFYRFNDNVSVGVGYTALRQRFDIVDPGESGALNLENRGAEVMFRVGF